MFSTRCASALALALLVPAVTLSLPTVFAAGLIGVLLIIMIGGPHLTPPSTRALA